MDDFRVGSVSPYDPIRHEPGEDSGKRKRKKQPEHEQTEIEDIVSVSGEDAEAEPNTAYSPQSEK